MRRFPSICFGDSEEHGVGEMAYSVAVLGKNGYECQGIEWERVETTLNIRRTNTDTLLRRLHRELTSKSFLGCPSTLKPTDWREDASCPQDVGGGSLVTTAQLPARMLCVPFCPGGCAWHGLWAGNLDA